MSHRINALNCNSNQKPSLLISQFRLPTIYISIFSLPVILSSCVVSNAYLSASSASSAERDNYGYDVFNMLMSWHILSLSDKTRHLLSIRFKMAEALGNEYPSGYEEDFVDTVEDDCLCLICQLPLREPLQTKCGHRFCKGCLEEYFRRCVFLVWISFAGLWSPPSLAVTWFGQPNIPLTLVLRYETVCGILFSTRLYKQGMFVLIADVKTNLARLVFYIKSISMYSFPLIVFGCILR